MNYLINFITTIEARSSLAHLHQVLSFILIVGGLIGAIYLKVIPAEYWVITSTFIGNGVAIFEFLFSKRKTNDPK